MVVCNFYLQGRCRYGEKCWNEHPRERTQNRGGSVNRVWVNPSQRLGGNVVQPSSFSRSGEGDWSRGNSGAGSSNYHFSSQNRFASLSTAHSGYGGGGGGGGGAAGGDENDRHIDTIQKDMEVWQNSGQWIFSCYALLKASITGFVELSPEELRMAYYTSRASGSPQYYINSVQQLVNQWRSRVDELRTMNPSSRAAMIAELNNPVSSSGSSSSSLGFGSSSSAAGFGPLSSSSGFGSSASSAGFGSSSTSGFGSSVPSGFPSSSSSSGIPAEGFGSSTQSCAAGFSFAPSGTRFGLSPAPPGPLQSGSTPAASSFSFAFPAGAGLSKSVATGFSFSSGSAGGFGDSSTSGTGTSGGFRGGASETGKGGDTKGGADKLFTPQSDLSPDELREFSAKRFTLGQIPLRPPPLELLSV